MRDPRGTRGDLKICPFENFNWRIINGRVQPDPERMKSLREITAAALQMYDKILFLSVGFKGTLL